MKKRWKRVLKDIEKLIKEQKAMKNIVIECKPNIVVNPIIIGCIPISNNSEISTIPTVKRYFYIPSSDIHLKWVLCLFIYIQMLQLIPLIYIVSKKYV
jgi:hypothetical protein